MYLFLSQKERESSILWNVPYLFWQEACSHPFFEWFFRFSMFISKKKLIPAMFSFKGAIIIPIEYSQLSTLSTFLYISRCQNLQSSFLLLIEVAIFSEQHRLYWNESSHLKQLLLCRKIFFRIPSCLEQLLLSNNYFLVTMLFSSVTSWR